MIKKDGKYPANGFRVCINSGENDISGIAYSPLVENPIPYEGFNNLLLKMDEIFDKAGYPQAFQEKRSFLRKRIFQASYKGIPEVMPDSEEIFEKRGAITTADILVTSRRDTSWQGTVYNVDGEALNNFNGEIELLQMLLAYRRTIE